MHAWCMQCQPDRMRCQNAPNDDFNLWYASKYVPK